MTIAEVRLWGRTIGAVSWDGQSQRGNFEYDFDLAVWCRGVGVVECDLRCGAGGVFIASTAETYRSADRPHGDSQLASYWDAGGRDGRGTTAGNRFRAALLRCEAGSLVQPLWLGAVVRQPSRSGGS